MTILAEVIQLALSFTVIICFFWLNKYIHTIVDLFMKETRELTIELYKLQDRINKLEAINKLDSIAKSFDDKEYKCFYCKKDIDKSRDFPFIDKKSYRHSWRCSQCNDMQNAERNNFNIAKEK